MTDRDVHQFTSTIRFCGLFNPLQLPSTTIKRYGCTVNADDIPDYLSKYIARKPISQRYAQQHPDLAGSVWCHLAQQHPPTLHLTDGTDAIGQVKYICDMATFMHIGPDRLLNGIPATLAVRVVDWIDYRQQNIRPVEEKRLQILAIQFTYADLVDNFDRIHKEHFR